jgi:hypothetical protein
MTATEPATPSQQAVIVGAPRQTVNWIIAGLLAVIATSLVFRADAPPWMPQAMGQDRGMLGARGTFAFTGQLDANRYGLFMMDLDAATVWCYEYNPVSRKMRLAAARSFRYDRYLENVNQESPTPQEVAELLDRQRQSQRRAANLSGGGPGVPATQPMAEPPAESGS